MAEVGEDMKTARSTTPLNENVMLQSKYFRTLALMTTWLVFSILIIILILFLINYESNGNHINNPVEMSKLRIVTRDEWAAQTVDTKLAELELPVDRVIITHSATEGCDTQANCIYRVRIIQKYHMESIRWNDIGYNFLVGGDGNVYEGRGWDICGAHTKGYNCGSIGITFIGTFTRHSLPQKQFDALTLLLEEGIRLGKLTKNYKMYPHRAFFETESPGEKIIEVLKYWPHYVGKLNDVLNK